MLFNNGDRIVFAGDSVTDAGRAYPLGEGDTGLGNGYVHIVKNMLDAWHPQLNIRVTNAGISGNTSRDLLARFDNDVLALNPDWAVICIGINDVWRQFSRPDAPEKQVSLDEYRNNLEKMLFSLRNVVNRTFLMTPYFIEPNAEDPIRKRMSEYITVCESIAEKYDCILVDLQKMFAEYCAVHHATFVAPDRVHPNSTGAMLIAKEFLKACEFDFNPKI